MSEDGSPFEARIQHGFYDTKIDSVYATITPHDEFDSDEIGIPGMNQDAPDNIYQYVDLVNSS